MPTKKKRILWLHPQPEFYHNCMLDDLARGTGYTVPGMGNEHSEEFEWMAGFAFRGPEVYTQHALPAAAPTVFLRVIPGKERRLPQMREAYHVDWRADLRRLGESPLGPDAIIISGYGQRTFREILAEAHRTGVPVAVFSDSNLRGERGRGLKPRVKRCLKRRVLGALAAQADCLLTANPLGVAYWRYYGGHAARRKTVICPYYTDYGRIDAARAQDRNALLAKFNLESSDRILFSAARLAHAKGLDLMLRAFADSGLAARGWKYLIAGSGPLEAELKAQAAPLGDAVGFLGFQQPADNLALMAHADVMVLPSRFEPHGIVVAEALAAGTPVLVSDVVGAARGLVTPGGSGLIFRSENGGDLTRQLRVLDDQARLAALRAAARPAFEAWYRRTSPILIAPRVMRELLARPGAKGVGT